MYIKAKRKQAKTTKSRHNGLKRKEAPTESAWEFMERVIEEFKKLPKNPNTPTDLAMNIDHYLYGLPKVND